eukprot:scaffold432903_cov25-Prasinocladus_malaysianus.AAC.1
MGLAFKNFLAKPAPSMCNFQTIRISANSASSDYRNVCCTDASVLRKQLTWLLDQKTDDTFCSHADTYNETLLGSRKE